MTLGESVRKGRLKYPDKKAIIFGEHFWTYVQFDEITAQLAASLIQLGGDFSIFFKSGENGGKYQSSTSASSTIFLISSPL